MVEVELFRKNVWLLHRLYINMSTYMCAIYIYIHMRPGDWVCAYWCIWPEPHLNSHAHVFINICTRGRGPTP